MVFCVVRHKVNDEFIYCDHSIKSNAFADPADTQHIVCWLFFYAFVLDEAANNIK